MRVKSTTIFNQFKPKLDYNSGLSKAQKFCAYSERCVYDMERKLKDWGLCSEDIDKVIDELVETDFINDVRYANSFVRGKFIHNQWGKKKIYTALKSKKISELQIVKSLQKIDMEEYRKTAKKLLDKKVADLKEPDPFKMKSKVYFYMNSRGFEAEIFMPMLD